MKFYKLKENLPTFNKGELFYLNAYGSLYRVSDDLMAYYHTTIAKFPNMLEDWFEEVPAPERDINTKYAFVEYLNKHKEERFFQAVRNFTREYLDRAANVIAASDNGVAGSFVDTFYWECDNMLKKKEEDDDLSDEEQRADEY